MSWLHLPPAPPPPMPPRISLEDLMGRLAEKETIGQGTPAGAYLRLTLPVLRLDKWGQPLPLSDVDQDRVDRLCAIMQDPWTRVRSLLRAGMLLAEEVDAVKAAFPEVFSALADQVLRDMMESAPPYREWAETTIGVLFGLPPAELLRSAGPTPEQQSASASSPSAGKLPESNGTAADRRDPGVRSEQRR
jgi:hypothetical protein